MSLSWEFALFLILICYLFIYCQLDTLVKHDANSKVVSHLSNQYVCQL